MDDGFLKINECKEVMVFKIKAFTVVLGEIGLEHFLKCFKTKTRCYESLPVKLRQYVMIKSRVSS